MGNPSDLVIMHSGFDIAAPGANTDIISSDLSPKVSGAFRITVAVSTSTVFDVKVTDGTDTHVISLNDGVALTANALYTFSFGVSDALDYNFRVKTDSVIEVLQVDLIKSGEL